MLVAANGSIDECELSVLDDLDAFHRLGMTRQRFEALARDCLNDVGAGLCERSWLRARDLDYVDALLDAVSAPEQRILVCCFAAAVISADGRVSHDESLVYGEALARWHISQQMVLQAIQRDEHH